MLWGTLYMGTTYVDKQTGLYACTRIWGSYGIFFDRRVGLEELLLYDEFIPKIGGETAERVSTAAVPQQHPTRTRSGTYTASSTYLPVMDSSDASCRGVAPGRIGAPSEVLSVLGGGPRAVVGSHLSEASASGAPSQWPGAMLASVPVDHAKQLRLVDAHFLPGALCVAGVAVADRRGRLTHGKREVKVGRNQRRLSLWSNDAVAAGVAVQGRAANGGTKK